MASSYRNRSVRCPHGFALDLVACPECGGSLENRRRFTNVVSQRPRESEYVRGYTSAPPRARTYHSHFKGRPQ